MLDDEPGASGRARRLVGDCLAAAGLETLVDDAQLVVSELVSNALMHAGPPAELSCSVAASTVRLEVRDRSTAPPVRSQHGIEAMTGRGLHVIEGLAHAWGTDALPEGKSVWAELRAGVPVTAAEPSDAEVEDLLERGERPNSTPRRLRPRKSASPFVLATCPPTSCWPPRRMWTTS